MTGLLLLTVVGLPLMIKDDGTARGFTQILLTYTLAIVTTLLGLATLWLSCGILARDIEEAQIQMLVVKPISRWQIWLGKWIGLVLLNALLLSIAGLSIFSLLQYRSKKLPAAEQQVLRNEIFVARGSLKEPVIDYGPIVEQKLAARLKETSLNPLDTQLLRKQLEEQTKAELQVVGPNYARRWELDLGLRKNLLKDEPLFLRVKFNSPETRPLGDPPTYRGVWLVGPPESQKLYRIDEPSVAAETFHEFKLPPNLFDQSGKLTIEFRNYNQTALLFSLDEGLEVLFREGGFGLNFIRGLVIILCWLSLLAAVGLCAATFLSFPVAAFFAVTMLIIGLSSGTLSSVVEEGRVFGNDAEGKARAPLLDMVFMPAFRGALHLVNLVQGFSPIDLLSSGRSIPLSQMGLAVFQIVILLGGIFAVVGVIIFSRRELARPQLNG